MLFLNEYLSDEDLVFSINWIPRTSAAAAAEGPSRSAYLVYFQRNLNAKYL